MKSSFHSLDIQIVFFAVDKFQLCPRPIASLRTAPIPNVKLSTGGSPNNRKPKKLMVEKKLKQLSNLTPLFVCKQVSAGSRHSLILMVDCQHRKIPTAQVSLLSFQHN